MSFYDAGKPGLVETVCAVMMCDYYPLNISQVPISLSHAMTNATASTRLSSIACNYKYILLLLCFVAVASSVLLSPYFFEADNSQNGNYFTSQSPSSASAGRGDTEVGRIPYGDKTNEVAPNNLPHLPGPFIGQDNDIEYITHLLRFAKHSHTKMVHIFGLPAVGKSTLAIHVGYEMAMNGVAVRYINVDETHIFKNDEPIVTENLDQRITNALSKRVSNIELPWYSHTEKKYVSTSPQGLIQWAKGLSNDTILVIDNCDLLLHSNATRKPFTEMFVDLNKASRFLHIVSTSRLKVRLLDGFKLHKLKPLDNESAIELLQSVSDVMTLNDSKTVNGLVGGIPLALKIVGTLVSEMRPPDLIIRELKENPMDILSPNDVRPDMEKMRPVLELSYKYLDTNTQECALYLSHFPGSFSHEAAVHILSNCTNSSPIECLSNLTDRSLLDPYSYAGQSRYQFHKLIKEYLKDVQSHKTNVEPSRIACSFNSSFLIHFTQVLSGIVSKYSELPHDDENIGRFEYESHNFECLILEKVRYVHRWPVIPFVNLTRSLTCQLIVEMFTTMELLKAGQSSLILLEDRMDEISVKIGASETLNLYCDLVLQLRKWIQSNPEHCLALCEETFLPNISSRYQTIDKLLAMSNYNKRGYYNQLKFPFYQSFAESICHTDCVQIQLINIRTTVISIVPVLLLSAVEKLFFKKEFKQNKLLGIFVTLILWYCFSLFFDSAFALSVSMVIYVSNHSGLHVPNSKLMLLFYILLCVILTGAISSTLRRDTIMVHFLFICIATADIIKQLSPRVVVSMFYIFIVVFIIDAYAFEIDTVHYVTSFLFVLLYPYWGYVHCFLLLRFPVVCVLLYHT